MPIATYQRVKGTDVGVIKLDDGKHNSISPVMVAEMTECLKVAHDDLLTCAGALVIAGSDKMLSSGFDMKTFMKGPDAARSLIVEGAHLIERILGFPRPVVVVATGHAIALGAFLLLTGDYRIGSRTVDGNPLKVGLNETNNNMNMPAFFVEGARTALAPQFLREAVALGLIFDAKRAQAVGFLDDIAPEGEALEAGIEKAKTLATWCKHPAFAHNRKNLLKPVLEIVTRGRQTDDDKPTELKWLTHIHEQAAKL